MADFGRFDFRAIPTFRAVLSFMTHRANFGFSDFSDTFGVFKFLNISWNFWSLGAFGNILEQHVTSESFL